MNRNKASIPGPLDGIKIVEYGVFHAGPGGTAILGDLGAEVIKIEEPGGDPIRYWTTLGKLDMTKPDGESLMYEVANRNKKGLCLNIKTKEGRTIFESLVKKADVFMCNLRKSTRAKMAIDYVSIRRLNEKIIYACVSGYGYEGPMADIGAFDPLGQACSGMMYLTGAESPELLHLGVLDQATAIANSHAIITALLARELQGIGQEVHTSLYGTSLWLQHPNIVLANALGIDPCVPADRSLHSPLRNSFCCKDEKWLMGTHHPEERYWATFCNATGQEELLNNPEFTDGNGRPINILELTKIFDKVFAEKTCSEWMAILHKQNLMFVPIQRIQDVRNDPQAIANDYIKSVDYRGLGKVDLPGYPIKFSGNQAGFKTPAPETGEHTNQIMAELGYTEQDIARLKEQSIIQ